MEEASSNEDDGERNEDLESELKQAQQQFEEEIAAQPDCLPLEGISYMPRQVNPIAFPRYGCYSDVVKNSAIPPFSRHFTISLIRFD